MRQNKHFRSAIEKQGFEYHGCKTRNTASQSENKELKDMPEKQGFEIGFTETRIRNMKLENKDFKRPSQKQGIEMPVWKASFLRNTFKTNFLEWLIWKQGFEKTI